MEIDSFKQLEEKVNRMVNGAKRIKEENNKLKDDNSKLKTKVVQLEKSISDQEIEREEVKKRINNLIKLIDSLE